MKRAHEGDGEEPEAKRPNTEAPMTVIAVLVQVTDGQLPPDIGSTLPPGMANMTAEDLPKDIWFQFLRRMSEEQIGRLAQVNHWFESLAESFRKDVLSLKPDAQGVTHVWTNVQLAEVVKSYIVSGVVSPLILGVHFSLSDPTEQEMIRRILLNNAPVALFAGVILDAVNEGTVDVYEGATVTYVSGGNVTVHAGGTVTTVVYGVVDVQPGGTVTQITGGFVDLHGATVTTVTGGTIEAEGDTTIHLGVPVQLNQEGHLVSDNVTITGPEEQEIPDSVTVEFLGGSYSGQEGSDSDEESLDSDMEGSDPDMAKDGSSEEENN